MMTISICGKMTGKRRTDGLELVLLKVRDHIDEEPWDGAAEVDSLYSCPFSTL